MNISYEEFERGQFLSRTEVLIGKKIIARLNVILRIMIALLFASFVDVTAAICTVGVDTLLPKRQKLI
jgi:hypothetical protein